VIYPLKLFNRIEPLGLSKFISFLIQVHLTNIRESSWHVGLIIGGVVLKEEKVKQGVSEGPQAPSFEELNPKQDKPQCI
jgi:hypothetical protein